MSLSTPYFRFLKDISPSAFSAGFVAVLVGFTSSIAIVLQAALAFNASPAQITSWVWALGWGMGLCTLVPSLWLKKPVMVAWSTPGAAVLATAGMAGGFNMNEAVGAFIVCALLIILFGVTGWFEKLINRIPIALASALLAGVLAKFGMQTFVAAQTALPLVSLMLVSYLVTKRLWSRYAIPVTLLIAIIYTAVHTQFSGTALVLSPAIPLFTTPHFRVSAIVSMALPLFVVTMASQNLPGVAAIRAANYDMPISKLITLTGIVMLLLAPFGAFALCLSAITAAMCMGSEAHKDPRRRYTAAATCGALYIVVGIFGATTTGLLMAFPKELVAAIAGLALLSTIGNALAVALEDSANREAALITFLVTLSGVVLLGVGSAVWGVLAGAVALFVQQYKPSARV